MTSASLSLAHRTSHLLRCLFLLWGAICRTSSDHCHIFVSTCSNGSIPAHPGGSFFFPCMSNYAGTVRNSSRDVCVISDTSQPMVENGANGEIWKFSGKYVSAFTPMVANALFSSIHRETDGMVLPTQTIGLVLFGHASCASGVKEHQQVCSIADFDIKPIRSGFRLKYSEFTSRHETLYPTIQSYLRYTEEGQGEGRRWRYKEVKEGPFIQSYYPTAEHNVITRGYDVEQTNHGQWKLLSPHLTPEPLSTRWVAEGTPLIACTIYITICVDASNHPQPSRSFLFPCLTAHSEADLCKGDNTVCVIGGTRQPEMRFGHLGEIGYVPSWKLRGTCLLDSNPMMRLTPYNTVHRETNGLVVPTEIVGLAVFGHESCTSGQKELRQACSIADFISTADKAVMYDERPIDIMISARLDSRHHRDYPNQQSYLKYVVKGQGEQIRWLYKEVEGRPITYRDLMRNEIHNVVPIGSTLAASIMGQWMLHPDVECIKKQTYHPDENVQGQCRPSRFHPQAQADQLRAVMGRIYGRIPPTKEVANIKIKCRLTFAD